MNIELDSEAYYGRSVESYRLCQYNESILFCKRALTSDPNHSDAHFQWASTLIAKKAYDKSIRKHKEILFRDSTDPMAYYNLGLAFEKQNELLKAEIQYRKSLQIDPSYERPSHNLAIVLTKQGRYTEALEQYEKNIRDDVQISSTYNSYGYLKCVLGKYEEAIESFDEAISRGSGESLPLFNKSMALYCMGKSELAIEKFKESRCELGAFNDLTHEFQEDLSVYRDELSRFENMIESDNVGQISKEQLLVNIEGLCFIVNLINQELTNKRE